MAADVLDLVRESCREVARQAREAWVVAEAIPGWLGGLAEALAAPPVLDPAHHFVGCAADTVAFVVCLDAVNFGSGYFPHLAKLPGLSGYFTVATRLTEHFAARGPLTASELAGIDAASCTGLLGQDPGNAVVAELMGLFARAWNDLGRLLEERHGGSCEALVAAAGGSAARLVERLAAMPLYRDVWPYRGREVAFYKRAQLTAADLHLALGGQGLGAFADLDRLTIFADNLLPHVLRLDGVVACTPELTARIEAGKLIPAGSPAEVELRAAAVHAVELACAELAARGRGVTAMQLDYALWNRGQRPEYKARPRHRTRTTSY